MTKLCPGKKMYVAGIYINGFIQRQAVEVRLIQRIPGGRWKVEAPFSFIFGSPPIFREDYPCELFVEERSIITRDEAIAKRLAGDT